MKKLLFLAIAAAMLAACGEAPIRGKHEVKQLNLTQDGQEMCSKQNDFSIRMLQQISLGKDESVFVSPLSASIMCAMIANGAKGETQEEILTAIGTQDYSMSELNAHYLNLLECLPYQDQTTTLKIADAVYIDEGYPVEPSFTDVVKTHYLAEVTNLDLSNPASADMINAWCKKQTNGLIKKICDESYFGEDLHLVLLNALYFKGEWEEQFKKSNTYEQAFHAESGDTMQEMMHGEIEAGATPSGRFNEETYAYEEYDERLLRLFYKDNGYCMDIILPKKGTDFKEWFCELTMEKIDKLAKQAGIQSINVTLPKFKLERQYRLNGTMQAMGMQLAFNSQLADFSGMSTATKLYLDLLQQNTYIEVDEEGTRAAAVTSGWMKPTDSGDFIDPFVADHPFVFLIRDVKNGIILFAGTYIK